ncbi:MAG TPA: glycosyltransferase [Acidimicrobiales bacterium]|nr:glycosyltransferase [Acidimicrobiales bacterium]
MTTPLHIAIVAADTDPMAATAGISNTGREIHVAELATHLGALGHEVTVHARAADPNQPASARIAPNVDVRVVPARSHDLASGAGAVQAAIELGDWLRGEWSNLRPDVVHSHFWTSGIAARAAADALQIPWCHTGHARAPTDDDEPGGTVAVRSAVETDLARDADLVIATTFDECQQLQDRGAAVNRITRIPTGVDLAVFSPFGPSVPRTKGRRRIVMVGRLEPSKGLDDALLALVRLPPDVELIVAGGPPIDTASGGDVVEPYEARARELEIADRTTFVGDLARAEIAALIRSADVVLCCPREAHAGRVAIEAMACGKPVVATRVGGLADTVLDGLTGVFVPPRDPEAISAAITTLMRDGEFRARLGQNAVFRARRYDWTSVAALTSAYLDRIGSSKRRRRVPNPTRTDRVREIIDLRAADAVGARAPSTRSLR